MLLPIHGGPAVKLHPTDSLIGQIRWLPDGKSLLTVLSEALTRQLPPWQGQHFQFSGGPIWRIYTDGRAAEQLTSDLNDHDLCCLHLAKNGTEIISVINTLVSDLWFAPAANPDGRKQISSDRPTLTRHAWLPDNETVAYRDLSGGLNVAHRAAGTVSLSLPDGLKVAGGVSACGAGPLHRLRWGSGQQHLARGQQRRRGRFSLHAALLTRIPRARVMEVGDVLLERTGEYFGIACFHRRRRREATGAERQFRTALPSRTVAGCTTQPPTGMSMAPGPPTGSSAPLAIRDRCSKFRCRTISSNGVPPSGHRTATASTTS
jgi:hypothetical protein